MLVEHRASSRRFFCVSWENGRQVRLSGDSHRVLHRMMECLAETLWRAERDRRLPDEQAYLDCLGRIPSSSS